MLHPTILKDAWVSSEMAGGSGHMGEERTPDDIAHFMERGEVRDAYDLYVSTENTLTFENFQKLCEGYDLTSSLTEFKKFLEEDNRYAFEEFEDGNKIFWLSQPLEDAVNEGFGDMDYENPHRTPTNPGDAVRDIDTDMLDDPRMDMNPGDGYGEAVHQGCPECGDEINEYGECEACGFVDPNAPLGANLLPDAETPDPSFDAINNEPPGGWGNRDDYYDGHAQDRDAFESNNQEKGIINEDSDSDDVGQQ